MLQLRRRNVAWLTVLGVLIAIALVSSAVPPALEVALLGIFAFAMLASFVELGQNPANLMKSLQRASRAQTRVSSQAKEAVERARRRGSYIDNSTMLVDVGLIALQTGQDGMVMRRSRSVSKDDDGIRPFIILNIEPEAADRAALLRFEITDHTGQQQYIHEMRTFLHDGEMNILADHHLPLANNRSIAGAGDWDLRVYIDGRLVGMHGFTLAPSIRERYQQPDVERRRLETEQADEDIPLSLEELLRNQSSASRRSR